MKRRKKKRTLAQIRGAHRKAVRKFTRNHRELVRKRKKISDAKYYKAHYRKVREHQNAYSKKYYRKNKKRLSKYAREYSKKWRKRNKGRNREYKRIYGKKYRSKHGARISKLKKKHYIKNKSWIRIRQRKYMARRRATDINFKLACTLRRRLLSAIRHHLKTGSAVRDLGCSIEFFKKYIEKKFNSRMTWKNHGKYWHLDHKKALFKFDFTKRRQLLKAVHYTNMQPLTIPAHLKKTSKERAEKAIDKSR